MLRQNDTGPARRPARSRTIPASAELMRLYSDYLHREYVATDSDYVLITSLPNRTVTLGLPGCGRRWCSSSHWTGKG